MNKKLERYRQLRDKKKARLEKAQKDMDRLEQMVQDEENTQIVAAVLKALFHGDADALELGAGLFYDVNETVYGAALGHKVIDDEHLVLGLEPILSHQQGHLLFVGIGENLALI